MVLVNVIFPREFWFCIQKSWLPFVWTDTNKNNLFKKKKSKELDELYDEPEIFFSSINNLNVKQRTLSRIFN